MKIPSLVSSRWLAQALLNFKNKPSRPVRVLDATWTTEDGSVNAKHDYLNKHIPGAVFFDIDECSDTSSKFSRMLPDEKLFSEYVQHLGITNDSHVVAYEHNINKDLSMFSSPRVWWMFRCFGHNNVSVLNGGFAKWLEAGFPVDYGEEYHSDANHPYEAKLNKELLRDYEEMLENVQSGGKYFPIVDARGRARFHGTGQEARPGSAVGHMKHSLNLPFVECLDDTTGKMKEPSKLREAFEASGVDLSQPFTASCFSGVTACVVAFAAHQCGCKDVSVYDGSWQEWSTRAPPELSETTEAS